MLKELFLGLIVVVSVLLFSEVLGLVKSVAIIGIVGGVIGLVQAIPTKTEAK